MSKKIKNTKERQIDSKKDKKRCIEMDGQIDRGLDRDKVKDKDNDNEKHKREIDSKKDKKRIIEMDGQMDRGQRDRQGQSQRQKMYKNLKQTEKNTKCKDRRKIYVKITQRQNV